MPYSKSSPAGFATARFLNSLARMPRYKAGYTNGLEIICVSEETLVIRL